MPRYIFEGNNQYEVGPNGERTLIQPTGLYPYGAGESWLRGDDSWKNHGPSRTYEAYKPTYIWDGIDRRKWPRTWMYLVRAYHTADWHQTTKWVPDSSLTTKPLTPVVQTTKEWTDESWEGYAG